MYILQSLDIKNTSKELDNEMIEVVKSYNLILCRVSLSLKVHKHLKFQDVCLWYLK